MPRKRREQQPGAVVFERAAAPQPAKQPLGTGYSHSPAEFFLKYVLTHDLHTNAETIAAGLERHDYILPAQPEVYIRRLIMELEELMPEPFKPQDPQHIPSQEFLYRIGVWDMWHPEPETLEAVALFENPTSRDRLRAFIASSQRRDDLLRAMTHLQGRPVSAKAVDRFAHYYWNMRLFGIDEREMLFLDYRIKESVRLAGQGIGRSNRTRIMAQHCDVAILDARRSWEDQFSNAYCHASDAGLIRDIKDRIVAHNVAVQSMYTAHKALAEHQTSAVEDQSTAALFTVRQKTRDVNTMQNVMSVGAEPKRLPGRVANLKVVKGEKEGQANGSKSS